MIDVGFISTLGRMRDPDAKRVAALANSIKEVGLLNPITVYSCQIIRNGEPVMGYGLIAGGHRLEAVKTLGWREVPAIVLDLGEQERIIAECDENLCVAELSPSDRAMFTARRKEAYEALHPEAKHGGDRKSDQVANLATRSFAHDQSEKTGSSARAVRRDAERGNKVSPAALAMVRGTKLDTGVYLDTLKSIPVEKQTDAVRRDLANPKPFRVADEPDTDEAAVERQIAALMAAWNRAGPDARAEFLERIA
jgi:ParB family transcriptional regulator, chromosome partitioning protein